MQPLGHASEQQHAVAHFLAGAQHAHQAAAALASDHCTGLLLLEEGGDRVGLWLTILVSGRCLTGSEGGAGTGVRKCSWMEGGMLG
jgi:hypothetical protein